MSARDLFCLVCREWRAPHLMESDACSLCKIALDAEMSALADARRDAAVAHMEDTATLARAYGPRTGHDFAPPALPLLCACGTPAVVQRGGVPLCVEHLATTRSAA